MNKDAVAEMSQQYQVEAVEKVVPEGYKQTEVGVIPEDWVVATIAEKHTLATGSTPPTSNLKNYGETYLFVSPADLSDKKYILKTEKKLSEQGFKISRKYPAGSTLFTCIGSTIGKTGLAPVELTSNQQINAIFPNEDGDAEFTYYAVTYIAPKVKALAGQQAVPLVNKTEFGETLFCFPRTKQEQTAIANALSDVDALISEQEKLIAKKQAIKTATMQQLLTGRTRLPQFALREDGTPKGTKPSELGEIPEDWEVRTISELGIVSTGGTPSTSSQEFWNGDIPWITPTDITHSKNIFTSERTISQKGLQSIRQIPANSLLVTCIASIGKNAILRRDGACNQQINAVVPNEDIDVDFLFYAIELSSDRLKASAGITATLIVSKALFEEFQLLAPVCPNEQTAIATILSDMDEEIQALEQRLNKTRQIKQGMMQELLTGKIRLVKPSNKEPEYD